MTTYGQIENMEFGEQVLRGGVGMIMLGTVLLTPVLAPEMIAGFAFAALYMVFTAILGWDPIYTVAQASQQRAETVKAEVAHYPGRPQPSLIRDYKQAA